LPRQTDQLSARGVLVLREQRNIHAGIAFKLFLDDRYESVRHLRLRTPIRPVVADKVFIVLVRLHDREGNGGAPEALWLAVRVATAEDRARRRTGRITGEGSCIGETERAEGLRRSAARDIWSVGPVVRDELSHRTRSVEVGCGVFDLSIFECFRDTRHRYASSV
jgi:hypothetical protein